MAWTLVAAVWISLLILSVVIYKVVQKLARKSYAEPMGYVKASRTEYPEDAGAVEESAEQPVKKIKKREEPEEPQPELVEPKHKKKEIQKNPLLEYIEEWKEPEEVPVAIEPVSKEKAIKKPKKGRIISPAKYPECFGTDYKLEKCKKDCGVAEECIKAVELLQRM